MTGDPGIDADHALGPGWPADRFHAELVAAVEREMVRMIDAIFEEWVAKGWAERASAGPDGERRWRVTPAGAAAVARGER